MRKQTIEQRLERYVDKTAGPTACWPWRGDCDENGYGRPTVEGHKRRAHRLTWEQHHGPVPEGLCVLHRCDNPPCCNPNHLWLGTRADNNRDRDLKGRGGDRRGEKHGRAKLTDAAVREIRTADGLVHEIAKRFGVSQATVSYIRQRKLWCHVTDQPASQSRDCGARPAGNSKSLVPMVQP